MGKVSIYALHLSLKKRRCSIWVGRSLWAENRMGIFFSYHQVSQWEWLRESGQGLGNGKDNRRGPVLCLCSGALTDFPQLYFKMVANAHS